MQAHLALVELVFLTHRDGLQGSNTLPTCDTVAALGMSKGAPGMARGTRGGGILGQLASSRDRHGHVELSYSSTTALDVESGRWQYMSGRLSAS